jgi:PleD family two-component response regulator
MTQPLAILVYEKLLPGSQLANRLRDTNYRVVVITDANTLIESARKEKPMVVLADLISTRADICNLIGQLRKDEETRHIPVIAFAPEDDPTLQRAAEAAGAALVVSETAILTHLGQFLEQALRVE